MDSWTIFIVVCIILFSLPDIMRRRKKYPRKGKVEKKQPPVMTDGPQAEPPVPIEEKRPVFIPSPAPAEEPAQERKPLPQTVPSPAPVPTKAEGDISRQDSMEPESGAERDWSIPVTAAIMETVKHRKVQSQVLHRKRQLTPAARQICAGIVWSELLQPPRSKRRR